MNEQVYIPSDDEKKMYVEYITEAHKREQASQANFDKSILTISSAGLGLSLTFLKDFASTAVLNEYYMYGTWIFFGAAVISTMVSFVASCKAQNDMKKLAYQAYILGDSSVFDRNSKWNTLTEWLNICSCIAFIAALLSMIVFVITNLNDRNMTPSIAHKTTSASLEQREGATAPSMPRP